MKDYLRYMLLLILVLFMVMYITDSSEHSKNLLEKIIIVVLLVYYCALSKKYKEFYTVSDNPELGYPIMDNCSSHNMMDTIQKNKLYDIEYKGDYTPHTHSGKNRGYMNWVSIM